MYKQNYLYIKICFSSSFSQIVRTGTTTKHLLHINNEDILVHRTIVVCDAYVSLCMRWPAGDQKLREFNAVMRVPTPIDKFVL